MKAFGTLFLVVGLLVVAEGCRRKSSTTGAEPDSAPPPGESAKATTKKGRGTFTTGKTTTYVTGPLDENGHIDYAAALNERMSKGVTPENNANVLIWKALGPGPVGNTPVPPEFFKKLGIATPPANGDYFVSLQRYNVNADALGRFSRQPWRANEEPNLHAWLTANQKPLALVAEATKRPQFFSPLVPPRNEKGSTGLINTLLPGMQPCREFAAALAVRAMLHVGEGDIDAAWQDLLACHRLGRLVGRGGVLIEGLVGMAIEAIACRAEVMFLDRARPDARHIEGYLRDLQSLPPLPVAAEKIDLCERCMFLDHIMKFDRDGTGYLQSLGSQDQGANEAHGLVNDISDSMWNGIDWNPALENANRWFDRMVAVTRVKDHAERARKWEQLGADLSALKEVASDRTRLSRMLEKGENPAKAKGQALGDILVSLLMPAAGKVADAGDRAAQIFDNVIVAFSLAWYQRENGRYPDRLDLLAPKYLKEVPRDLFSGGALVYQPTRDGFLLYSVGVNGRDDSGRSSDDQPPGDDLVVRIPVPPPR